MRRTILTQLIVAAVLALLPLTASAFDPSGLLEIHYINVGWGTSVLVIGPDGTTLLMDGGRDNMGVSRVIPYMQSIGLMPSDGLSYILASHLHSDHIAGLTEVMTHGYDVYLAVYYNGSNYNTSYVTAFRNAASQTTAGPARALALGTVIQLGNNATATCVCANGTVLGHGAVPGALSDENDRSVGLLIKLGNFEYVFAGDLGGGANDIACTGRNTSQVNVETPLAQAIMPGGEHPLLNANGVEVLHVNHHGSESSTNSDYMNLLTPRVACIAVGSGQSPDYMFPRHDVVDHVLRAGVYCITAPPAIVLQNEEGNPAGSLTSYTGYCVGDIIIKTAGVVNYLVSGTGDVTEGPDERNALGMPLTIPLDEPPADTTTPSVLVISPNGGEVWTELTQHNITWTATDSIGIASYAIDYSTNAGGNWIPVQPQTNGNPQTFSWTVPSTSSPNCLVRIKAWDAAGNMGSDLSNSVFTIVLVPDTISPVVHVTSPNGGEHWSPGTQHNITWTATDAVGVTSYAIDYSTNSGANWIPVQPQTNGNPQIFPWSVPSTPSANCLVRVRAWDLATNMGNDPSDSLFTIAVFPDTGSPVVTVLAPNGGELWFSGDVDTIRWLATDDYTVDSYSISYSTNGGGSWIQIQPRTTGNPQVYPWVVPNVNSTNCKVLILCWDSANHLGTDVSNTLFRIHFPDTTGPEVNVMIPNGAEVWAAGSSRYVFWNCHDTSGVDSVSLQYSTDYGDTWLMIFPYTNNNPGYYEWTVPATPSRRALIRVLCKDILGNESFDTSDDIFTIRKSPSAIRYYPVTPTAR